MNAVFIAIPIDIGKVLDVEPISRSCKSCFLKSDLMKTDATSYAEWRNSPRCKYNYIGSGLGLGGRGRLTDAVIDRLQNYFGVAIRQNPGNLKWVKAGVLATLFHVAPSKDNNWHFPHCPAGNNSWFKYNLDINQVQVCP